MTISAPTKSRMIEKIENELRPVTAFVAEYRSGPINAANFPKISKNPKYSPDCAGGTIFPK